MSHRTFTLGLGFLALFLAACAPATESSNQGATASPSDSSQTDLPEQAPAEEREYRIVTLLPRDAIPAIDNPAFLSAAEADQEYDPQELVMGVVFNGDARAYPIGLLSSHEIVNDTVGGKKISVTW